MRAHQLVHSNIFNYPCTSCDKQFKTIERLKRHKIIHTGEKPFVCDTCNKAFNDVSALGRHKALHEVQETKAFKCSICDNSFKTKQYLKSHTMYVHEPVEMLECKANWRKHNPQVLTRLSDAPIESKMV